MVHNIPPTQERLHRLLRNVDSPTCTLCHSQDTCNLSHALFTCSHNSEVGQWLLHIIRRHLPRTAPQQVVLLDLNLDEHLRLPIIWLVAKTLSNIFSSRMDKKACTLFNTRATLEASIMLLRKTRHRKAAETLQNLVSQSWYLIIYLRKYRYETKKLGAWYNDTKIQHTALCEDLKQMVQIFGEFEKNYWLQNVCWRLTLFIPKGQQ